MNRVLTGIPASPGIVLGRAKVLSDLAEVQPPLPRLLYTPEEVAAELERFQAAVEQTEEELTLLREEITASLPDQAHILDLYLLILKDRLFLGETRRLVKDENLNAERALYQALQKIKEVFRRIEDPYIRGRIQDVEGVYRRLSGHLTGANLRNPFAPLEPVIIVARDLSPADTTQLSRSLVLGFILERGGKTSHTAILAQSLEIPAVVGLDNATREISPGDHLILDGLSGKIILEPDAGLLQTYLRRQQEFEAFKAEVAQCGFLPAITLDEYPTRVMANIELPEEVSLALKYGADGIGLYRTEFLYLRQRQLPREEELFQDYRRVVEAMHPRVVTFRTLDIGGDKFMSPLEYVPEMNPALGLRAIRFCLKEQEIFRLQLRAILRASAYGQVRVMFPLISSLRELTEAREMLQALADELRREGLPFDPHLPVGAMIEVPAAVTLAHLLNRQADFFSIGTNDLIQYALAIDRGNKQVADMYQPLHPAVLLMIRQVVQAARAAGIAISMCGEMAGDPLYIPILLGLGVDELSMNARAIPMVKRIIRMTTLAEAREMTQKALALATVEEINGFVTQEMKHRFPEIFRFGGNLTGNLGT